MLQLILVGVLLCTFLHGTSAEINARISKEVQLQHRYSYTVAMESQLVTIAKNETHLLVNSTDSNFNPCAIAFEDHSIQQRIEAAVIDRKVIVWGVRTRYKIDIGNRIEHAVLIVDPWQCSFKAASTFEEEDPSNGLYVVLAQVVAHDNSSLDVFYPSMKTCAPCRYSIDGKRSDLKHQLERKYEIEIDAFFRIQRYDEPRHEIKYLYTHTFGNGSSVIELLDENFRVVKQRFLDHNMDMDMIAANPSATPDVHVCYMTGVDWERTAIKKIVCERFDANLQLLSRIRLPMILGRRHLLDTFSITVGPSGDLFIPVMESTVFKGSLRKKFVYYHFDSNNELQPIVKVYELPDKVLGQWRIRGFFDGKEYCIENTADYGRQVEDHEFVKCVIV